MPKKSQINLLPLEEFEASTLGRTLKWAMSTFRIIVIVTEMVVMSAFLSRFWLDARNSDLSDSINLEVSRIEAQVDVETKFRDIQNKLNIYNTLTKDQKPTSTLDLIASKVPQDVFLTSISIQDETTIRGVAGSDIGTAQFVSNLKAEPKFKTVELGSVNSSEDNSNLTIFTIKISL